MKRKKTFLLTVLAAFSMSVLASCNQPKEESSKEKESSIEPISYSSSIERSSSKEESSNVEPVSTINSEPSSEQSQEPHEYHPTEIGDTVKDWWSKDQFASSPFGLPTGTANGSGDVSIAEDFGLFDECSLLFDVKTGNNNKGYVGTDLIEEPYFDLLDAKNGDIISLSFYVPSGCNVASLQLVVYPSSMNNPIEGDVVNITDENEEEWLYTEVSFDTLESLGAIRIVYSAVESTENLSFYADDITIILGEETVKTGYEFNDESLYQTYEDYFKVGTCMSGNGLKNSELRRITKDNFNSITAENEGKPERILDQAACQELAENDNSAVAITTAPFEKIYDFAEANGIGVRHHTFVWYSQTPDWFFTVDYTQNGQRANKDLMLKRMENFIRVTLDTINERWPGLVYAIDVANEAIDQNSTALRKSGNKWYDTVGEDFVYYAFLYADKYKEDYQKLYYNDFRYDYYSSICDYALNNILERAIEEDLVDGVGIQGHIDSNANIENLIEDARLIHAKGLDCQITELDITTNDGSANGLNNQGEVYKNLIKKILVANNNDETSIDAVILWGITDDTSWRGANQNPLLFSTSYAKKPSYYGFLEAIDEI